MAGSYDFKAVKLFAQYGKVDNDSTGNEYKIAQISAAVPITEQGKLLAGYGRVSPEFGAARKTFTVGYDHYLSKRTDLYAMYMSDRMDGLSNGTNFGVGVRHRF